MDIVKENAIPAFLESHQLTFELESVDNLYNDIIFTSQEKEYELHPQVEVPFDLTKEKNSQQSADTGHFPWRIDPIINTQMFLEESSRINTIDKSQLNLLHSTLDTAIVEVKSPNTDIKYVYLKRLVRPTASGIWTVIGYDSLEK